MDIILTLHVYETKEYKKYDWFKIYFKNSGFLCVCVCCQAKRVLFSIINWLEHISIKRDRICSAWVSAAADIQQEKVDTHVYRLTGIEIIIWISKMKFNSFSYVIQWFSMWMNFVQWWDIDRGIFYLIEWKREKREFFRYFEVYFTTRNYLDKLKPWQN